MASKWTTEIRAGLAGVAPTWFGSVAAVTGGRLIIDGLGGIGRLGDRVVVKRPNCDDYLAEIVGADGRTLIACGFGPPDGVAAGDRVVLDRKSAFAAPSEDWLGCVLDWRAQCADGTAPPRGPTQLPLCANAPPAEKRKEMGPRLPTYHAVFDTFLPLCRGQRIGLFAGSGVGKSSLLGSLARQIEADVTIVALIGERGREVRSFVADNLDADIMRRSIVFYSTSDQPALMKRQSAHLAMTTAEYFRASGKSVLFIFDSLTRYAHAHREIALTAGEPPAIDAYPPSTFDALAQFAERAGPGLDGEGDITAIFSILVGGSNMDEPIADCLRGILDGHVVLERKIAERGRFPAIDVRRSVSRALPAAACAEENRTIAKARELLSTYEDKETIIKAGLYKPGGDFTIDHAIYAWPRLDQFFSEIGVVSIEDRFAELAAAIAGEAAA